MSQLQEQQLQQKNEAKQKTERDKLIDNGLGKRSVDLMRRIPHIAEPGASKIVRPNRPATRRFGM